MDFKANRIEEAADQLEREGFTLTEVNHEAKVIWAKRAPYILELGIVRQVGNTTTWQATIAWKTSDAHGRGVAQRSIDGSTAVQQAGMVWTVATALKESMPAGLRQIPTDYQLHRALETGRIEDLIIQCQCVIREGREMKGA
jgi:hypothetical protein